MESMTYFITALLLAGGLQSGGETVAAAAAVLHSDHPACGGIAPWILQEQLARTNLGELNRALSGAATLREYCALVVIQELLVMVAGFSLLADFGIGTASEVVEISGIRPFASGSRRGCSTCSSPASFACAVGVQNHYRRVVRGSSHGGAAAGGGVALLPARPDLPRTGALSL